MGRKEEWKEVVVITTWRVPLANKTLLKLEERATNTKPLTSTAQSNKQTNELRVGRLTNYYYNE